VALMIERSLVDRVLGFWEERWIWEDDHWAYLAFKALAEAVEDTQRRLDNLEEVVPPPPRWPTQQVRVIPPSQGGA
jgi:hypothetical protein